MNSNNTNSPENKIIEPGNENDWKLSSEEEIADDVKKWVDETIRENPYEKFELHWWDEHYESENEKKERISNEELDKKIHALFNKYPLLEKKSIEFWLKYKDKIKTLKLIFLHIWVIQESRLHSKDTIIKTIIWYMETEEMLLFTKYINGLIWFWEWKQWFPKEIVTSLFKLQSLLKDLFPNAIHEESNLCMWYGAWWWKIR